MNMTGEVSVERACGQILFGLKMSNLNYMVRETPFSAYVTIRKKFIKSYQPDFETPVKYDQSDNKKELENTQKKIKSLLTDIAQQKYDLEEYEIKLNAMEKINAELELKHERTEDNSKSLRKEYEKSLEKKEHLEKQSAKLVKQNTNLKIKTESLDKKLKDEKDLVLILENTVSTKLEENVELKAELEKLTRIQFPCIFCELKFETEECLKEHVRSMHDKKCPRCDLAFRDKQKLKDHTCKLNIRNPSHGNCYMKNWILVHGCTPIINKATMTEVATLHCDDCWRKLSPCGNLTALDQHDEHAVYHGKVGKFIRNGLINWSELMPELH